MSSRKASAATPPPTAPMQAPSTAAYVGAAASSIPSSQQQQRIISAGGTAANTVLAGSGNPSRSHTAPPSMSQAHHLLSLSTLPPPPILCNGPRHLQAYGNMLSPHSQAGSYAQPMAPQRPATTASPYPNSTAASPVHTHPPPLIFVPVLLLFALEHLRASFDPRLQAIHMAGTPGFASNPSFPQTPYGGGVGGFPMSGDSSRCVMRTLMIGCRNIHLR
jgi:hypothetical protein